MVKMRFVEAINEAIRLEMRRDKSVIVMGEDVAGGANCPHLEGNEAWGGVMGATKDLVKEFGRERVLDTPISEAAFVGAAGGAAATGLRPIVELMFIDFIGVCYDQVLNQIAKLRYMTGGKAALPLVIRSLCGAGSGAGAQHSQALFPICVHIPGIKVVVPTNPMDAKGLLISSIRDDDPVMFFEDKTIYWNAEEVPEGDYAVPLGKAKICREGTDVTVVGIGKMVLLAKEVAEQVAEDGISCEVIDPRTLSPLDEETILGSIRKTGKLVVVDECYPRCSIARDLGALAASKAFESLKAPVQLVTGLHAPIGFSPSLENFYMPNREKVTAAIRATVG